MLLLYFLFVPGLLLLLLRASITADDASGARVPADALHTPKGQLAATTPPARKTALAVSGGMLWGVACSWGFVHLMVPKAGHIHSRAPSEHELCLSVLLTCSTVGLVALVAFLLSSAKHHLASGIFKDSVTRHGPLLLPFSCSGLIHLFVPANGGVGPAGLEPPLLFLLLLLCFMGILMLPFSFGAASVNPGDVFSLGFRGQRAGERGAVVDSPEGGGCVSVPRRGGSTRPAVVLVALTVTGLVHLLVNPTVAKGSGGLTSGCRELPMLVLFLAFLVSLVMVFSKISA